VPDQPALRRVQEKLDRHKIAYYAWSEPDFDLGFTALATVPLDAERKKVLSNYRLLKFSNSPVVSPIKMPGSNPGDAGENPAGRSNHAEVAQLLERPCAP
jgi:hypothetical protein